MSVELEITIRMFTGEPGHLILLIHLILKEVRALTNRGVALGITEDTKKCREGLAQTAGLIFSHAFLPVTGGERLAEELDLPRIAEESKILLKL